MLAGLPSDMVSYAHLFVGDHSASNSEQWAMTVGDRTLTATVGNVLHEVWPFEKGQSYPVTVQHLNSTYGQGQEDFDYRAWVDRYSSPTWTSGDPVPSGHEFFVTDPQNLFQRRFFAGPGAQNPTTGKTAEIHFPLLDLDIDSDADGTLGRSTAEDFAETDQTQGLFTQVHSGDMDGDGIKDNFDFNGVAGLSFTPLAISLSYNLVYSSASQISLIFNYDADGMSLGDSGLFRIWKKDGDQVRSSSDLIQSGQSINASSIGLTPGSTVTLFLEAVNSTRRTVNFDPISVIANVVGGWNGTLQDKVHASGWFIDLMLRWRPAEYIPFLEETFQSDQSNVFTKLAVDSVVCCCRDSPQKKTSWRLKLYWPKPFQNFPRRARTSQLFGYTSKDWKINYNRLKIEETPH